MVQMLGEVGCLRRLQGKETFWPSTGSEQAGLSSLIGRDNKKTTFVQVCMG